MFNEKCSLRNGSFHFNIGKKFAKEMNVKISSEKSYKSLGKKKICVL